ncbi:MAG: late competence development ComFB family protein [Cyanobacteria bacterium]|nr:late competence development ComFB family protein [Cyanobacteriota bacterium]
MERLVAAEVEEQLKQLPERVLRYVKRVEVETYALNRLPPLYASSEKGWQHQCDRAHQELKAKITHVVRQAFAAVQVDPIRLSQPLQDIPPDDGSQAVLQLLREWFKNPTLDWAEALIQLRQLRRKKRLTPQSVTDEQGDRSKTWRPGTYGSEVAWKPRNGESQPGFDWNDNRYR